MGIPYLLIAGLWYAIKYFFVEFAPIRFFYELSTFSFWFEHTGAWYVAMLVPLYALYPFYYKLFEKFNAKLVTGIGIAGIGASSLCLYLFLGGVYSHLAQVFNSFLAVMLGTYVGKLLVEGKTLSKIFIAFTTLFYPVRALIPVVKDITFLGDLSYAMLGISVCFWAALIFEKILPFLRKPLGWMGAISLELYLTNIYLIQAVGILIANNTAILTKPWYLWTVVYLGVCLVGVLWSWLVSMLAQKIMKKKRKKADETLSDVARIEASERNFNMKILIIRNYPSYMDVKHNTYNIQEVGLAKALIRRGHVCDIVFWGEREETVNLEFDGDKSLTIYYRTGRNVLKNALFHQIDDLIAQYDVIQPCEYNQIQAWKLAKKYPQKTVIYHGPYYSSFNKGYNKLCKLFDAFCLRRYKRLNTPFLVKSNLAEQFLRGKGIENVQTVGVGIDLNALATVDGEIPPFIENIPHTEDVLNLLYVGRFEPRRNIPFLYEVAAELKNRGCNVRLITVGQGDADYVETCRRKAEQLNVTDIIVHTEKLEQKYLSALYSKCDYFLLPTHYEIFGMVLLEAMYYGLTCFTTENGGSDMLISSGENGYVLPLDARKWADTIVEKKNVRLGAAAHATIENHFTWDRLAQRFETAYMSRTERRD